MKPARHLLLLLFSMLLPVVTTAARTPTPSMTVEQPSKAQGQFFVITVSDALWQTRALFRRRGVPDVPPENGE
ncbi:hypothetical protein [Chlorobaculum tepidum]|uniref:hypothetical protein n=1 Tax=Chlorobaculum tepidum TaxID=1097 RepID=UPI0013E8B676|nr:hypothetical protein [Chlorobaculum tepidum]